VTANDPELADRVRLLRNHGYRPKYYNKVVGGNFRLDALQAAVLRVKLKHLEAWTEARRRNADRYRQLFCQAGLALDGNDASASLAPGKVVLPAAEPHCRHIYNQFVIRTRQDQRPALHEVFKRQKIGYEVYYPVPPHLQECFAELGYKPGDLPESEAAAAQTTALPIFPELTEAQQQAVVAAVAEAIAAVPESVAAQR
jgi:dTDP-4-amino-4,6-dideoxygalactose transaminase